METNMTNNMSAKQPNQQDFSSMFTNPTNNDIDHHLRALWPLNQQQTTQTNSIDLSFNSSIINSSIINSSITDPSIINSMAFNDAPSLLTFYDDNSVGLSSNPLTPTDSSNSSSPIPFGSIELSCKNNYHQNFANTTSHNRSSQRLNNYCETVAVESSGHVAQIVGKNGCKIKHLRAKYGTYIHTPSSQDEPVFIIKGRRDKVMLVKQEIQMADSHFAQIKQQRNNKIAQLIDSKDAICIRLFIPAKYIGLVVGRNGWFVKDLQLKYQIYIETPKFDLCNYFQLYGQGERLHQVKKLIFEHILKKTGIQFHEQVEPFTGDVYFVE